MTDTPPPVWTFFSILPMCIFGSLSLACLIVFGARDLLSCLDPRAAYLLVAQLRDAVHPYGKTQNRKSRVDKAG